MTNFSFSANSRTDRLLALTEKKLDLLVIGGGITGAGILLDASARGFSTGLVEMQDFAGGTSGRSTKLVHGGLRYLKQLELKLVRDIASERECVYENAPHVTKPETMMLPIVKGGTFGRKTSSIGLKLYDTLAKVKREERRYMLNKKKTLEKEPLLTDIDLIGSGIYVEYRTDDARLTLEVIKKASELGATPVNYTKVFQILYDENGRALGVKLEDKISGKTYQVYADFIVNAGGPWVDEIRDLDGSKHEKHLKFSKGVHLVFDRDRFPLSQAVYFDALDGRMIFAIPRESKTYVGTTDTDYYGDLHSPRPTKEDRSYLLKMVNKMFPSLTLIDEDIESSWAGIRPLIYEEGKTISEISRKDEIFISESGLISIAGGKLTGYRKMAKKTVDLLCEKMDIYSPCPTKRIPLSGGEVGGSLGFPAFIEENTLEGQRAGLTREEATFFLRYYGSNALEIFALLKEKLPKEKECQMPRILFGQLVYAMRNEMAVTPLDFFQRRTGLLLFGVDELEKWKEDVITLMSKELGWTQKETSKMRKQLEREVIYAKYACEKAMKIEKKIEISP